jgi:thiol:disulfide interchange protein DsbA
MAIFTMLALAVLLDDAASATLVEGRDYIVLQKPIPNASNTLIKVFSYDCPFCYQYDKTVLPVVVLNLPAGMKFRPLHLKTRGRYGVQATELLAVLLVRDQANGLSDKELYSEGSLLKKAMTAYYQAYHDRKERWDAGIDSFLKTGLDAVGMTRKEFEAAKTSPKVKSLLDEWEVADQIYKLKGVPAFVVNGRCLILNQSIKSLGSMLSIISELAGK